MRTLIISALALGFASAAHAETITATVNGMVCAFCATGIEKSFKKLPAVDKVHVDLATKLITLQTKGAGDLDDATIQKTIKNAGYAVVGIKRQ